MYVRIDFLWSFLVDKMSCSLHHNNFLQIWHIILETTIVYVLLDPWCSVYHIQIPYDKLHGHLHLHPSPWCRELPIPAIFKRNYKSLFRSTKSHGTLILNKAKIKVYMLMLDVNAS